MIDDTTMPFCNGNYHFIKLQNGNSSVAIARLSDCGQYGWIWLDGDYPNVRDCVDSRGCLWFPCTSAIQPAEYERNVDPNNPNFNEKERLQFTLDLFVQNDLWPIFNDAEITELYQKIYYEKPKLLKKLQELQKEIDSLQSVTLLSAEFDEKALLAKYDRIAIDNSIIQYYQAVQQWTGELLEKLFYYEYEKKDVIQEMKEIRLKISELSSEQQNYQYFADLFAFDMDSVKAKIRSVKAQADALEQRIDDIDSGENAIYALAKLESQERASFSLVAENTAKIVRNALKKIEFFEVNREYVLWLVGTLKRWKNSLAKSFEMMKEFRNLSEKGKVNSEIVNKRLDDWQNFRMKIEDKFQLILKKELRQPIPMVQQDEITVGQKIIAELEVYRSTIDTAYYERKIKDGNISEYSEEFRNTVSHVIANCAKAEDKIEILNIMDDLFQNKNE